MPTQLTAMAPPRTLRRRIVRALQQADWRAGKYDRTRRLRDVIGDHIPWWDWGHRLMALVGRNDTGSWGPPRVRDLYFLHEYEKGDLETGKPGRAWLRTTRDGMTAWDGRRGKHGREESWKAFDSQDDGMTIRVGWLGDDGRLHDTGIDGRKEIALFRRWLLWDSWVKAEWFGLRRWLYYKGLHAAVEIKVPFTCQLVPPAGSGGYSHWHCTVRRPLLAVLAGRRTAHDGPHRFGSYRWVGSGARVEYEPEPVSAR